MSNLLNNSDIQVQALINAVNQQAANNQADNSVSDAENAALQKKIELQIQQKQTQLKSSITEHEVFTHEQNANYDKALRGGLGPDAQRWAANPELQSKLTAAQKRLFLASFGDNPQQASRVASAINNLAQTPNFAQTVPTTQAMGELHAAVAQNPTIEEPAKQLLQTPFMQAPRANTATKADFMRFGLQQMSKGSDMQAVKVAGDMLGVLVKNVPGRTQQRAMGMVRRDPDNTDGMKTVDKFVRQPMVQKLPMPARGAATEALVKANGSANVAEGLEQVAQALTTGAVTDATQGQPLTPAPAAKKMSREMKARLFATIASGKPSELRGISDKALLALQSGSFPTQPNQVKRFMTALQARISTNGGTAESIDPEQLLLHSKSGPLPKAPVLRSTQGLSDEDAHVVRAHNRALVMKYYQQVTRSYAGVSDKLAAGEYLEDVRTLPNLREADKIDTSQLSPEDQADLSPLLKSKGGQIQGKYQQLKVSQQKRMRELRGKRMPKAERMKKAADRRNVGLQPRYFNVSALRQGRQAPALPMPGQGQDVGKTMGQMGTPMARMPVANRGLQPGNDGMMASAPNPQMRSMGMPGQGRAMPMGGGDMSAQILSGVDRSQPLEAQMAQVQAAIAKMMGNMQSQLLAATQTAMQALVEAHAPQSPATPQQPAPMASQRPVQPMTSRAAAAPNLELPQDEPSQGNALPLQAQGQPQPQARRAASGGEAEFLRAPGAGPAPEGTQPKSLAPVQAVGDQRAQSLAHEALAQSGQMPVATPGQRNPQVGAVAPGQAPQQGFDLREEAVQVPAPHLPDGLQAGQGQGFARQPAQPENTLSESAQRVPGANAGPMVGPASLSAVAGVGQQRSQGLGNVFAAAAEQNSAPQQALQTPQFAQQPGVAQPGQFGQQPGVAQPGQFGQQPGVSQPGQFGQQPGVSQQPSEPARADYQHAAAALPTPTSLSTPQGQAAGSVFNGQAPREVFATPGQPAGGQSQPGSGQQAPVAQAASPSRTAGMSVAALAQAAAQGTLPPSQPQAPAVGVNPQAGWAPPSNNVGVGGTNGHTFGDAHAAPQTPQGARGPDGRAQEQALAASGSLPVAPQQNAGPMGGPQSLSAVEAVGARPQGKTAADQVAAYRQAQEAGASNGADVGSPMAARDAAGIPPNMRCPISLQLMERPVKASDGQVYDRSSIERWMAERSPNPTSPLTHAPLTAQLEPQDALQRQIQAFAGSDPALRAKLSPAQQQAVTAAVSQGASQSQAVLRMVNSKQPAHAPLASLLQEIHASAPPPANITINPNAQGGPASAFNPLQARAASTANLDAPPELMAPETQIPAPRQSGPVQGKTDGWGIQRTFERDLGGANRAPARAPAPKREVTNPFIQNEPSYAELEQEKYSGRAVVKPSTQLRDVSTLYNTNWRQMTQAEQAPFKNLGWTQQTWDTKFSAAAKWPNSMRTRFAKLSVTQRKSVRSLGFSPEDWDGYVASIDGGGGMGGGGGSGQGGSGYRQGRG